MPAQQARLRSIYTTTTPPVNTSFTEVLKHARDCLWEDDTLRVILANSPVAYLYSKDDLDAIDPRLLQVIAERVRLSNTGFHINLKKLLTVNMDFWGPSVYLYREETAHGEHRFYFKKITEINNRSFTPGDYVRASFSEFDEYVTENGVHYAYSLVSRERDIPIDWFDNYQSGSTYRIRVGLALELNPKELALWAFEEAVNAAEVELPDDVTPGF